MAISRVAAITAKNKKQRKTLWPDVEDEMIWNRKKNDGFVTVPRTMPYFRLIMNSIADKGKPVFDTYFSLWCRSFDEPLIKINDERLMAIESGFSGQRAVYTWRDRINKLSELGFLKTSSGPVGIRFVLILNPYFIIEKIKSEGKYRINEEVYFEFHNRAQEIGATQ